MATSKVTSPAETSFTAHLDGKPIPGTPAPEPCPFCKTSRMVSMEDFSAEGRGFHATCDECGAYGPLLETARAAAEAWNRGAESLEQSTDTVALNLAGVHERAIQVVQLLEHITDAAESGTLERTADNLADPSSPSRVLMASAITQAAEITELCEALSRELDIGPAARKAA